jgi:SPP1 family predicted phage head-tail adaptor
MDAGRFDTRVSFERLSTTTDAEGSTVETWTPLFSRWANIQINNATETFKNDQDFAQRTGFAIIRLDPETKTLLTDDRLLWDGAAFDVLGVMNVQNRDELLEVSIRRYAG